MKRTSYLGHVIVVRRRRTGVRSFSSAFPEYDVYYQSQLLNTFSTMESAKQWIREHAERKRKNPTKAQKREKAKKASASRRVALALAKFLKQANPAMKTAGAEVQRLKGGVIKITPIKANAAHWQGWMIPGVNAGFKTKAAAQRHIREHGMTGVKPVRVKKPSDQLPIRGRL